MPSDDAPRTQAARQRLQELQNHATIVLYQCRECDTVIPFWATHLQIARGQRWPPWIENKACCNEPHLLPQQARKGTTHEVLVCMRLIKWGEGEAFRKHWNENLQHIDLEDLQYRPTMRNREDDDEEGA